MLSAVIVYYGRDPITAAQEAEEPLEREQGPYYQVLAADLHCWRRTDYDGIDPRHLSSTVVKHFA